MFLGPDGQPQGGIAKVGYSHAAMADLIIANPAIDQNEIAQHFGYTAGWVSQIIASDSFQTFLATRKDQILDPVLRGAIEESFKGLVLQSIAKLRAKLDSNPSDQLLLEVFKNSSRAMGYGARPQASVTVNNVSLIGILSKQPERVVGDSLEALAPAAVAA